MSSVIWFLVGLVLGFLGSWVYNFVTDKINLMKMGYNGGSFIVRLIYNKYFKKS
jgi:uncharacterized membrane protein YeaQ/YmgE (transglycosylase-associated protein family)